MERKYLVATHGELATGFQNALKILADQGEIIEVINAYVTDDDYTTEIVNFINQLKINQQGVIFTDLFGGSVNQKVVAKVLESGKRDIFIISNANLAIILSLIFVEKQKILTEEFIESQISESQVRLVPTVMPKKEAIF